MLHFYRFAVRPGANGREGWRSANLARRERHDPNTQEDALHSLASVAMLLTITAVASAQWDPYPWRECRALPMAGRYECAGAAHAFGKPDLSGFWMPENAVSTAEPRRRPAAEDVPAQAVGAGLYNERSITTARITPARPACHPAFREKDNIPDGLKLVQTERPDAAVARIPHDLPADLH